MTILEEREKIKEVRSEVEKELETSTDGHRQSAATGHLNIYRTYARSIGIEGRLSWDLK